MLANRMIMFAAAFAATTAVADPMPPSMVSQLGGQSGPPATAIGGLAGPGAGPAAPSPVTPTLTPGAVVPAGPSAVPVNPAGAQPVLVKVTPVPVPAKTSPGAGPKPSTDYAEIGEIKAETMKLKARIDLLNQQLAEAKLMQSLGQISGTDGLPTVTAIEGFNNRYSATLSFAGGSEITVREGDALPNGMKVVRILPQGITVMTRQKREIRLPFQYGAGGVASGPSSQVTITPMSGFPTPPPIPTATSLEK